MYSNYKGIIFALFSGLFFGLIGYFGIMVIRNDISVFTMLFWRFAVSGCCIALLLLIQFKKIDTVNAKDLLKVLLYGVFFYSTGSILYFLAAKYIGSGLAMVIFFTYPALVMLINQLYYRMPFNRIYSLSLVVIFTGMIFLIQGSQLVFDALGIFLSILSALLYAFYILVSKKSPVSPLLSTLMLSLGCMLTSGLAALMDNTFEVPIALQDWLNIIGIGVICTALPILLLLKGLKYISSTQASILSVLEPVFVVVFGILLLKEQVSLTQMIGVSVILAGSLLSLVQDNKGCDEISSPHGVQRTVGDSG